MVWSACYWCSRIVWSACYWATEWSGLLAIGAAEWFGMLAVKAANGLVGCHWQSNLNRLGRLPPPPPFCGGRQQYGLGCLLWWFSRQLWSHLGYRVPGSIPVGQVQGYSQSGHWLNWCLVLVFCFVSPSGPRCWGQCQRHGPSGFGGKRGFR